MTVPELPELQRARQWSSALASALDEVSARLDSVARRIAEGWPDAHGGEWTERLLLLRRALAHDADAAAELGRAIDRVAWHVSAPADDLPAASHPAVYGGTSGPRLGATTGRRVDDERGVTIPRLTDAADAAG